MPCSALPGMSECIPILMIRLTHSIFVQVIFLFLISGWGEGVHVAQTGLKLTM